MLTELNILPVPRSISGAEANGHFTLAPFTLGPIGSSGCFQDAVGAFFRYMRLIYDAEPSQRGSLSVTADASLASGEYVISSDSSGVSVFASDSVGANHGLSALLQLITRRDGALFVPICEIHDSPECPWRGLMVDLARVWHSFDTLLNYVDICWYYRLSRLQLHFIDTQSYTLPSAVFPNAPTENRHYSFGQIACLVEYARVRGITIVPEFEAPGHSRALISAYPEVFGNEGADAKDNIICAGRDGVFDALRSLLAEICELFPHSPYIHIGGDEAEIQRWSECPRCREYMSANGLASVRRLYTRFIKITTDAVIALGRTPVVWEGFPQDGSEEISRKTIVVAWESHYQLAPELLDAGFDIYNCSWQPLYVVPSKHWTHKDVLGWNIYNWQHFWENSPAHLNPITVQPTEHVLGGQLCAWECSYEQELLPVLERLPALSERTWSIRRRIEDDEFAKKASALTPKLIKLLRM